MSRAARLALGQTRIDLIDAERAGAAAVGFARITRNELPGLVDASSATACRVHTTATESGPAQAASRSATGPHQRAATRVVTASAAVASTACCGAVVTRGAALARRRGARASTSAGLLAGAATVHGLLAFIRSLCAAARNQQREGEAASVSPPATPFQHRRQHTIESTRIRWPVRRRSRAWWLRFVVSACDGAVSFAGPPFRLLEYEDVPL
jgi:hypothetical protein